MQAGIGARSLEGMNTRVHWLPLGASLLWLASGLLLDAQSLGDVARKERERKKAGTAAKSLTNEEIEKPFFDEYPSVQARFAMPKGWAKPTPSKNIVISACPGTGPLPAAPFDPETVTCAMAVGIDGPTRRAREDPNAALDRMQGEIYGKATRQIGSWSARELGGLPARETTFELSTKGALRHMRMVVAVEPKSGLIYMAAVLSIPERFNDFAPALDTVLATFEAVPKPPPVREN